MSKRTRHESKILLLALVTAVVAVLAAGPGRASPYGTPDDAVYEATPSANGAVARLSVVPCAGNPANPVLNCSFETGDFTGWVVSDLTSPFFVASVVGPGVTPGFGFFVSTPTDGVFAAVNGFDGDGPGVIRFAQDVVLPAGARNLVFDTREAWDLATYDAVLPRDFVVTIEPSGGGAPLQTTPILTAPVGNITLDTGDIFPVVDVSAFAGAPVRVSFDWIVPENFTGPAFAQLDNVDVQACGNGLIEPGEGCDDGNLASGDGCDTSCQVECQCVCGGSPSVCTCPAFIGVTPTKLITVDKLAVSKAKVVYVAKDPAVTKGAGTDATMIGVEFTAAYDNGLATGDFVLPAADPGWLVNKSIVAKFVNKSAPAGVTQAKVGVIKPAKLLKLVGKGLGDTAFDIFPAGDPAGDVHTSYCVENGGDENCHCSTFSGCAYKLIAGGTGAKLVCKSGAADGACSAICP
jgi:cysteine-rich repeat protein